MLEIENARGRLSTHLLPELYEAERNARNCDPAFAKSMPYGRLLPSGGNCLLSYTRPGLLLGDRAGSAFANEVELTDLKSNRSARLPGGRMSLEDSA